MIIIINLNYCSVLDKSNGELYSTVCTLYTLEHLLCLGPYSAASLIIVWWWSTQFSFFLFLSLLTAKLCWD